MDHFSVQNQERKARPQPDQAINCPRCESTNTKFCYYNNYSLSQPRYFCKSCRRYWTKGGTLRNVPVGGGCRKNKRSSSSSSSKFRPSQDQPLSLSNFPSLSYDSNDLNLAFARLQQNFPRQSFDEHDFAAFGNHPATHCDLVAGNHGFSGSISSFQNLHNWFDIGNNYSGNHLVENGGNKEMGLPTKQEVKNGENRVMWGFPWQMNGEESWNGNAMASSWQHGLLNSALM